MPGPLAVNTAKRADFRQKYPKIVPKTHLAMLEKAMRALGLRLLMAAFPLLLAGCTPPANPAPPTAAVSIPMAEPAPPPLPELRGDPGFQDFVRGFREQALAQGITPQTWFAAFNGVEPVGGMSDIIAEQPEFVRPIWRYLDGAVSARRIKDAKIMLARHADLLAGIEEKQGVPREILVAVWGMETDFGTSVGSYNIFATLATRAWMGGDQRQAGAERELIAALRLLQQQDFKPSQMVASWAGAFGQTQFMPTTFARFGVDGDGDGKIDLWHSPADALASAANLLARQGWQKGMPWAVEVTLPKGFAYQDADLTIEKPLSEWRARGVRPVFAALPPDGDTKAALYVPAGAHGAAFLTFANFRVIMRYNNAASYALSVGVLADRMMDRPGIKGSWPLKDPLLSRAQRQRLQAALTGLGFDSGEHDGLLGTRTRAALRLYQGARGLVADGYPSLALLERLDREAEKPANPALKAP